MCDCAGTLELAYSASSATNTAYIDNLNFTDVTGTATLTEGAAVRANTALIVNNARVAGELARRLGD